MTATPPDDAGADSERLRLSIDSPLPLFYGDVELVDPRRHRTLRIAPAARPYAFAAATHVVPAVIAEFRSACRDLPILFVAEGGTVSPLFLVGLHSATNLYVGSEGRWLGRHVPAYLRRYPYIGADVEGGRRVICIDRRHAGFGDESGERLFDDDGAATEALRRAAALVSEFADAARATSLMTARLLELGLFKAVTLDIGTADGADRHLAGFSVVDEPLFSQLPGETLAEFARNGWLAAVEAHWVSIANLAELPDRAAR